MGSRRNAPGVQNRTPGGADALPLMDAFNKIKVVEGINFAAPDEEILGRSSGEERNLIDALVLCIFWQTMISGKRGSRYPSRSSGMCFTPT